MKLVWILIFIVGFWFSCAGMIRGLAVSFKDPQGSYPAATAIFVLMTLVFGTIIVKAIPGLN